MFNARSSPVDKSVSVLTDPDPDPVQVEKNTSAVNPVSGPVNYNTERSQKVTTKIKKVHVIIEVTALLLGITVIAVLSFEISKLKYESRLTDQQIQKLTTDLLLANTSKTLAELDNQLAELSQRLDIQIKTDRNSIQTLVKEVKDLTHQLATVKSVFFSGAISSETLVMSFLGYVTAASNYVTQSHSIILFDKIWANEGNAYNKSTGDFIAPCDGFFQFTISTLLSKQRNDIFQLNLKHKDRIVFSISGGEVDWQQTTNTNTAILKLAKGDWVNVQVAQTPSSPNLVASTRNYHTFTGNMLKEL